MNLPMLAGFSHRNEKKSEMNCFKLLNFSVSQDSLFTL